MSEKDLKKLQEGYASKISYEGDDLSKVLENII
jgi:hypothetical protein